MGARLGSRHRQRVPPRHPHARVRRVRSRRGTLRRRRRPARQQGQLMTAHRPIGEPAPLSFTARDGAGLDGTLYLPREPAGVAVLINAATGVPRRYYDAFARHLAGRGLTVLTYDYRNYGSMEDRGRLDLP